MAVESAPSPTGGPPSSVFGAHPSAGFGRSVLLGLLLSFAAGCIPLIPEDEFLSRANDFALSPELTCEQLRVDFGVPDLPTVNDPSELGIAFDAAPARRATRCQKREYAIRQGIARRKAGKVAMGFEPMKNGFAIRSLSPLGHATLCV